MSWVNDIQEQLAVGVGALVAGLAAAIGVSKVRRSNANDNKEVAVDDAASEVIKLLRAEVERATRINKDLQDTVYSLHIEVAKLRAEVIQLRSEHERQTNSRTN